MVRKSATRRTGCPINFGLEIFGDRWMLLILRDLLLQNKRRFQELLNSDEGIATNILSDRLKKLEAAGVIDRSPDPADGRKVIYRATEKGIELVPVLLEIAAWGAVHDAKTDAPADFVPGFKGDRDRTIAAFVARLREE